MLRSKGLTDLLLSKFPFVNLKNRILRSQGMNIYENKELATIIAPNTIFGYDLRAFTIFPGVKLGEGSRLFDHYADSISMTKGAIVVGEKSIIGGFATILPGTIIGENCNIGVNSVVKGFVPNNSIIMPNSNYYCYNNNDFNLMKEKNIIKIIKKI